MPLTLIQQEDGADIVLAGSFTYADTAQYHGMLLGLLATPPRRIRLMLGALHFMDSAGFGMLIVTLKECAARDVALLLYQPRGDIKALLSLTHAYDRFTVLA